MGAWKMVVKPKVLSGYSRGVSSPRRRKRRPSRRPWPLTIEQILAWADAHRERTGRWPNKDSGRVRSESFLTWRAVDGNLRKGQRGLPGGSSLARLLAEHRGLPWRPPPPPLTIDQILAWADAHHETTGRWPNLLSGPVVQEPSETWIAVDHALRSGGRGLPGGSSLPGLLAERRGTRNPRRCPG